ncbi:UNVERIFIED_CONTAM: hypothetical protein FKN15_045347 [Acipenser sinensis]
MVVKSASLDEGKTPLQERIDLEGSEEDQEDSDEGNDSPNESSGKGDGEDGDAEKESENPNAGWAEAMARILLKKTPESKTAILLKNKELEKVKAKEKQERLERRKQVDKKRQWEMMCRVKPDVVTDRETERNFQRIATRGVVQLFNAVRKHQTNINEKVKEAGGSERKRAKLLSSVSKKDFIDVLRGNEGGKTEKSSKAENGKEDTRCSIAMYIGVVQLFNAVRKHQTNINEKVKEAGGSERKRAKLLSSVSKKDFIDVLRGNEGGKTEKSSKAENGKEVVVKSEDKPSWNILRDDFMMGATMKDWDKESDEGEAGEAQGEEDNSDSD